MRNYKDPHRYGGPVNLEQDGVGIKRGGVGLSGPRATSGGQGKDAELNGTGEGEKKNKDAETDGTAVGEENGKAKSNADFKAMFLKKEDEA